MSKRINHDDIDRFHEYGIHIPTRTLYLGSESYDEESGVDGRMAERAVKNLHLLDSIAEAPITALLSTYGGETAYGMAIHDAIKNCRSHVTIKASGPVMSMGMIILQAGDVRLVAPNAQIMIHYGSLSVDDSAVNTYRWVEASKRDDRWFEQMFLARIKMKHPDYTLKQVKALLKLDTILSAQETVDLGLADGVIGATEET